MAAIHLLRPGQIIRARGESWVVDRHVAGPQGSLLAVHGRGPGNRGTRASFLLPFELIVPHLADWERAGEVPRALHAKAATVGLLGIGYPEEVGGGGEE